MPFDSIFTTVVFMAALHLSFKYKLFITLWSWWTQQICKSLLEACSTINILSDQAISSIFFLSFIIAKAHSKTTPRINWLRLWKSVKGQDTSILHLVWPSQGQGIIPIEKLWDVNFVLMVGKSCTETSPKSWWKIEAEAR